jgi:hypothetical protein
VPNARAVEGKTVVLASGNNNIKCETKKWCSEVSSEDMQIYTVQFYLPF